MNSIKRGLSISIFLAFTVLLINTPLIAAEILGGQTESLYNLGDPFNISVSLLPSKDTTGFFSSTLICDSQQTEIYRSFYTLKEGERKEIIITGKFDDFLLGNISEGSCSIRFSYDNEQTNSREFDITKRVDISLDIQGVAFDPGKSIIVKGKATKANGLPLTGFAGILIPNLNITILSPIQSGNFEFNITLPLDALPGVYEVQAHVYEKDSAGKILNEGNATESIKLKQIMKDISISFPTKTVTPGNPIEYTVNILDQAGQQIEDDVGVTFYKPDSSVFDKKLVRSAATNSFPTESNYTAGDWKVLAKTGDLEATNEFYVDELMTATFSMINGALVITNTGNVRYKRPVEISIGGVKEVRDISVGIDESKNLKLVAPTGEYDVQVSDGTKSESLGKVSITGSVISLDSATNVLKNNFFIWIWVIILIILAVIAIYYYRRVAKKKYTGTSPTKSYSPIKVGSSSSGTVATRKLTGTNKASVIEKGQKQEAAIISLYIRNMTDLQHIPNSPTLEAIQRAVSIAKETKAKIYAEGDYKLLVFAPALTGETENIMRALRTGQEIDRLFNESNKKFVQKLDFGLGIHIGDIVVDQSEGKFKFTPLGNTVGTAKRISNYARSEVLISEAVHKRTSGKVKAEKVGDMNIWRAKKIMNRGEHEEFIRQFMNRQKNEKDPRFSKTTSTHPTENKDDSERKDNSESKNLFWDPS